MANRNGLPFKLVVTLIFILPLGACFESSEEVESNFGGSVGDGPITGALIEVWTADGRLVTNQRSDSTASYQIKLKAKRGDYPLVLTAKGGTDLVTNAAPDFELVSTLARPGKNKTVNLNPFSTFAIRTAQSMAGGLTEANVATADSMVMNELGFGLDTALISNTISGQVDNSNVAAVIKASEAVGEMLRRTDALVSSTGSPGSITDVINSLSDDLVDGVIDGRGAGAADPRIAALSRVVSAQVLLETMTNSLHVNGILAVDAMDAAILVVTNGTGTQSTRDVPVTAGMLEDLAEALRAAAVLGFPDELTAAISIVQDIEAGAMPAQVTALLPAGLGAVLDSLVITAGSATATQIEEINDLARMDGLPPIDGATEHEVTITVEAGGSVLTSGSAGECTSTCTVTVADGEILTLSPQPDSGFTFAGWGGACSRTADCVLTVTSNLSVTAEFIADTPPVPTHFLSLTLTGNGLVLVAPDQTLCEGNCLIEFDEGQVVTLSASADEGFVFDAWSGDCAGAASCTLTMSADQQVNAAFSALPPPPPATHMITMSVVGQGSIALNPTGTICDSTCTVTVEDATVITAVAEPSPGHVFDAWSGDCSGSESCQLTVSSNKTLVATFSEEPPPAANEAPVAVVSGSTIAYVGQSTGLLGNQSYDPDGDLLTYNWVLLSKPTGSNLGLLATNQDNIEIVPDLAGSYEFSLVVNDGLLDSNVVPFTVTASEPSAGNSVTSLSIEPDSGSAGSTTAQVVTFGQPFTQGSILAGTTLAAQLTDGSAIPIQVDLKTTHSDGSMRFAIITVMLPNGASNEVSEIELINSVDSGPNGYVSAQDLPPDYAVNIELATSTGIYSASSSDIFSGDQLNLWLDGPLAAEWYGHVPLKSGSGESHPHLNAIFYVRFYPSTGYVRTQVVVENNWTYEPAPSDFTYDVTISRGAEVLYAKNSLTHRHHTRWRKIFGDTARVKHDRLYLRSTGAIPAYDMQLVIPNSVLASMEQSLNAADNEPMGTSVAHGGNMGATGGRSDIGVLPRWTSNYMISGDSRALASVMATGDAAGSWSTHFRDKNTGLPVSLVSYPQLSTHSNLAGKGAHPLPACSNCNNPNRADTAHQPSLSFVPFILTGDHFHLEELQFWANFNSFGTAPEYREHEKALYKWQQLRAQAWSMRTLGQLAWIIPDNDPMRSYFKEQYANNINDYNQIHTYNPNADPLFRLNYPGSHPNRNWQDDLFTVAMDYLTGLNLEGAAELLAWKVGFPLGRILDPGYCWLYAAPYALDVQAYTFADLYAQNAANNGWPALQNCTGNQITIGYPSNPDGYPTYLQAALAGAINAQAPNAQQAWDKYLTRTPQVNYVYGTEFAIVPRNSSLTLNQ